MSKPRSCNECGLVLPANDFEGLCPVCLLRGVLERQPSTCDESHDEKADRHIREQLELWGNVIEKKIGQGGCGAVYLTRTRVGDSVALKVMRPVAAGCEETAMKRFEREIALTRQLRHSHIVELLEAGNIGPIHYFTMTYYPTGSVANLMMKHGGRLPLHVAGRIILDVLDGMAYAHQTVVDAICEDGTAEKKIGVVHRDLKPSNILLSGTDDCPIAIIADFGLAKAYDIAGYSGFTDSLVHFGGTVPFAPPEQAFEFKRVKPVGDVWAAAATFYNMLTGFYPRTPQPGLTPQEVMVRCPIVPIRVRDADVPEKVASVIDHALAERIADRIQTMTEFRQELERVF